MVWYDVVAIVVYKIVYGGGGEHFIRRRMNHNLSADQTKIAPRYQACSVIPLTPSYLVVNAFPLRHLIFLSISVEMVCELVYIHCTPSHSAE